MSTWGTVGAVGEDRGHRGSYPLASAAHASRHVGTATAPQTRTAKLQLMMQTPAQTPSSRPSRSHQPPSATTARSASSHSAMHVSRLCRVACTSASASTRWNVRVAAVGTTAWLSQLPHRHSDDPAFVLT